MTLNHRVGGSSPPGRTIFFAFFLDFFPQNKPPGAFRHYTKNSGMNFIPLKILKVVKKEPTMHIRGIIHDRKNYNNVYRRQIWWNFQVC